MKLHQLKTFVRIAATGSIHGASRELNVSQPALTKALKSLEEELGVPLITRFNTGVRLTDFGQRFLLRAQRILGETEDATRDIKQMLTLEGARVSVGVSPASVIVLPPIILEFRKRYPHIQVDFHEFKAKDLKQSLLEKRIDFAIGLVLPVLPWLDYGSFEMHVLHRSKAALAVRTDHPLGQGATFEKLLDYPWIASASPEAVRYAMAGFRKKYAFNSEPVISYCNSIGLYFDLMTKTDAVSLWLVDASLKHDIFHGKLRQLDFEPTGAVSEICLIQAPDTLHTPATSLFYRFVKNHAAAEMRSDRDAG